MLFQDARDYQIAFLSSFLILGLTTRDWTLKPELIGIVILTCLITQWISDDFAKYLANSKVSEIRKYNLETNKFKLSNPLKVPSLRSATITALGLSLLLRADSFTTMMLAGFMAILSKHIFRFNNKHFFNPANFGIISALVLTPDAWVSPGQWGDEWWYALLFVGTGGIILRQVGRWDTTVVFLGAYALLEAVRNIWLGWTWDVFLHRLMSGSLLLFALFMLTDPRSIPSAKVSRCIWAICIAGLTFILRNQYYVPTAIFWSLFVLAPLTILLDIIWNAPIFDWLKSNNELGTELETNLL